MNIQEIDSTQILNTLGLNSEIISDNEIIVLTVLLDKIISDYNLNNYDIDIRTKDTLIFKDNDNTFKINFDGSSTLSLLINDSLISNIRVFSKEIIFNELYNGHNYKWNISLVNLLDIDVSNNDDTNSIHIMAKACGIKTNSCEFMQFKVNNVEHLKAIYAATEYDKYNNTFKEIDNYFSKTQINNKDIKRSKRLFNGFKK